MSRRSECKTGESAKRARSGVAGCQSCQRVDKGDANAERRKHVVEAEVLQRHQLQRSDAQEDRDGAKDRSLVGGRSPAPYERRKTDSRKQCRGYKQETVGDRELVELVRDRGDVQSLYRRSRSGRDG